MKDEAVSARRPLRRERILHSLEAILGFPVFVYGAAVNGLPYLAPRWLARRLARKETDYATARFLAGVVAFPLFWTIETGVVGWLTGAAKPALRRIVAVERSGRVSLPGGRQPPAQPPSHRCPRLRLEAGGPLPRGRARGDHRRARAAPRRTTSPARPWSARRSWAGRGPGAGPSPLPAPSPIRRRALQERLRAHPRLPPDPAGSVR